MRNQFVNTVTDSKNNMLMGVPSRENYLAWHTTKAGTAGITYHNGKARRHAFEVCPWASEVVAVEGGYLCFEDMKDYSTWKAQK